MPAIPRHEFLTEEDRKDIERRRAEMAWEAGRPYREAEARRRKEVLNQLYTVYQPALNNTQAVPFTVPPSSTALSLERQALIEAALEASDAQKLSLLLGPTNPLVMTATLFHDTAVHRRLALYHFTLVTLRNATHALSPQKAQEILLGSAYSTPIDKSELIQSLKAIALSFDAPLSHEEKALFTLPTWIEILAALDKKHLNESPEAKYVADCCRHQPPERLNEGTLQVFMHEYVNQCYQQRVKTYFKENPQEREALQPWVIASHQTGIESELFLEKTWSLYQKASGNKKEAALACLQWVMSNTSTPLFPLNPLQVAQCRFTQDLYLFEALARQYRPLSTKDFQAKKAVVNTLIKAPSIDNTLVHTLSDLFDSDKWGAHFPHEMILSPPKEHRRTPFNEALYKATQWPFLNVKQVEEEHTLSKAKLHHWHEAAITESLHPESLKSLTQHTLRQKSSLETSPPFLAVRLEAIQALLNTPKEDITDQTLSLLNILLGPKAHEAKAHAAQWYYTPGNILSLHTYWTLLSAAQVGYERLAETQGEEVARASLDKPIPLPLQDKLYVFLKNLYATHQNHTLPSKEVFFEGSCLEVLERAYQQAKAHAKIGEDNVVILEKTKTSKDNTENSDDKALIQARAKAQKASLFMHYALNQSAHDFSLSHIEALALTQEKNTYLQSVYNHLTQYPEDIETVIKAFGIEPSEKEGFTPDETHLCLLLTLEEEKFLTPATFEKETAREWMKQAVCKETEEIAWALMTRGATLPLGERAAWEDARHIVMLYAPCDTADEMFRQAIETYTQGDHGQERWMVIMEALRATRDSTNTSFFDNALTLARFSRFKLSTPQLQQIVESCAAQYSNKAYGPFVVLPPFLFGTEPTLPLNEETLWLSEYAKEQGDFKAWYKEKLINKKVIILDKTLPAEDFYRFVRRLRRTSLHTLYVQGASSTEITTLLSWMPKYTHLKTLSFVDTSLDNITLKNILTVITGGTLSAPLSLETLDLSNTQLTDKHMDILLKYYPWGRCQTLNLSANLITDSGAKRLLTLLSQRPSHLSTIEWGKPACVSETLRERIQTCLNTTSLTRAWVDDNTQLTQSSEGIEETVLHESAVLSTNVTVDHENTLLDETQTEDLEVNPVVLKKSSDWASYVKGNTLLLTTEECILQEAQITDFITWLSTTDIPLHTVAFDGQTLSLQVFEQCLQHLTRFEKLATISLKNMPLSWVHTEGNTVDVRRQAPLSPYMQVLTATLPHLPQLTQLDLSAIPFSKADANALIEVVPYCQSLKTIELDNKAATEKRHALLLKALMAKKLNAVKGAQKPSHALMVQRYPLYRSVEALSPLKEKIKYLPKTPFSTFFTTTQPEGMIKFSLPKEENVTSPLHPTASSPTAEENNDSAPSYSAMPPEAAGETAPLSTHNQQSAPKRAFVPRAFKKQANLATVPDAPTLFFTTQQEITLRFGKKEGHDYDAEFNQLIERFIGKEEDSHPRRRYRYAYYHELSTQLETLVKTYSNVTNVTPENPNNAQVAAGIVANALSGLPVLSYVGVALQFGVDQATAWNNALFREQMKEFYDTAQNKKNKTAVNGTENNSAHKDRDDVFPLIQYLAFLVALRYGDRAVYLLTPGNYKSQAKKDAALLCNFIGYGHRTHHPILKDKIRQDNYWEVTLDKMDAMMAYLFDGVTFMQLPMLRADWEHTQQQLQKGQAIGETRLIPMDIPQQLVVYPSKPQYFYDETLSKEWRLDEQHFRQMLLKAVQQYRQKWERLNFFEQKAVEFFYAHGGQHSMEQCKAFEDLVTTQPFKMLLDEFSKFFDEKVEKHSSLREGALHTEIVRAKFVLGQSRWHDKDYQARLQAAKEKAKNTTSPPIKGHERSDAFFGFFAGSFIQQSLNERQTLIEEAKILDEKISSPSGSRSTP